MADGVGKEYVHHEGHKIEEKLQTGFDRTL